MIMDGPFHTSSVFWSSCSPGCTSPWVRIHVNPAGATSDTTTAQQTRHTRYMKTRCEPGLFRLAVSTQGTNDLCRSICAFFFGLTLLVALQPPPLSIRSRNT